MCCRIPVSRVVACPYSSVAVWQRDTVASTATHTGLLWLGSSVEKKVFSRLQLSPCVDGLGWAACFHTWYGVKESYACSQWCMGVCSPPAARNCLGTFHLSPGHHLSGQLQLIVLPHLMQAACKDAFCLPGTYHQRHELWPGLFHNPVAGSSHGPRNPN